MLTPSAALPQLVGAGESRPLFQRIALAGSAFFVVATVAAALYGRVPGPTILPFMPIVATLWSVAELLTAFLLFSQFYVGGKISLAFMASAYAMTGLMTIPYLYAFPGIFQTGPLGRGDLQTSVWIWAVWHCTFPIIIAATHLVDPTLDRRTVSRAAIGPILAALLGGALVLAAGASFFIWAIRDGIMVLVVPSGHFTRDFTMHVSPIIVGCNLIACFIVSLRLRKPDPAPDVGRFRTADVGA